MPPGLAPRAVAERIVVAVERREGVIASTDFSA
jgi:hypothetical protein